MTLVFLLKCTGVITLLCSSKAHLARRIPGVGSVCQNLSSCLTAHIDTVREFQGPGQDPLTVMKGFFLWTMTPWLDFTDGNAVSTWLTWRDKELKELRCWQKWCQLFIWDKKTQNNTELLKISGISVSRDSYFLESWAVSPTTVLYLSRGILGEKSRQEATDLPAHSNEIRMHSYYWIERSWRQGFATDKSRESHIPWAGEGSST